MHENKGLRHVGFKSGPPKVAMHAMLKREWVSGFFSVVVLNTLSRTTPMRIAR